MNNINELATRILDLLGGSDNVVSITHCATRLRPKLKDQKLVNSEAIEDLDGVTGIVNKEGGFQIIIGTSVGKVYEAFLDVWKPKDENTKINTNEKKSFLNEFVALVVSIFSPLLPLLAGSGLIRGFTILANEFGILSLTSTTNAVLTFMATAVFHFLPLLVAMTTAKRFKTSPYIAVAIIGVMIMPGFMAFVEGDGGNLIKLFGLSVPVFNYTSQVIPAIIVVWLQSIIEHFLEEKLPISLHMFVIPTVLIFILTPFAIMAVGPVGNYISIGVAKVVDIVANINPILTGAIIGGIWNILIMFGIHWAPNTMVIIPEIARTGSSALIAYGATANFGMAGAALAIFIRSRNRKLKNFALTSITSVMLSGIVEPAIYGLGIRFKTPLVAGCLGAALGGAFMGAFNVVGNAFVFGGLTTIPAFAGATLWAYIVGLIIAFIGGMVLTFVFGVKDPEAEMTK